MPIKPKSGKRVPKKSTSNRPFTYASCEEIEILKKLEIFVLDNSIRETTVGAVYGHTLQKKLDIVEAVKKARFSDYILGVFGKQNNVDDQIAQLYLHPHMSEVNRNGLWGACEAWKWPLTSDGTPSSAASDGLEEICHVHKLCNAVIEIDSCDPNTAYDKFDVAQHVCGQVKYAHEHLHTGDLKPRVLVNLRDFANFTRDPSGWNRALDIVHKLGQMDPKPFGIMVEDPTGMIYPDIFAHYIRHLRNAMAQNSWDGKLLIHVHFGFGLSDYVVLKALANGADGVWSAVCSVGAAIGHVSSASVLTNLARLGNQYVQENYNLPEIIKAAQVVEEIVTEQPVLMREIYGKYAFDLVFGPWHGWLSEDSYEIARMIGQERHVRVTDFANSEMIQTAMAQRFGAARISVDPAIWKKCESLIDQDLLHSESLNYNTPLVLLGLYARAGGKVDEQMLGIALEPFGKQIQFHYQYRTLTEKFRASAPCYHMKIHQFAREFLNFQRNSYLPSPDNPIMDSINTADVWDFEPKDDTISLSEFSFRLAYHLYTKGLYSFHTPEELLWSLHEELCKLSKHNEQKFRTICA